MRPRFALFGLAVVCGSILGCGPDHGGGEGDTAEDGPTESGSSEASSEGGAADGGAHDAPSDGSATEGGASDAQTSDGGSGGMTPDAADAGAGSITVTADASLISAMGGCAAATSLTAAPNATAVGTAIQLSAAGIDGSGQSADVSLTWTATGSVGTLSATTGATTTLACATVGVETITVTAAIANGGASCPSIGSLHVTVTCEPPLDGGVVVTPPDTGAGEDTGADADAAASVDGGSDAADGTVEAEASAPGSGAESGAEGGAETSTGGSLVPCTASTPTGCVSCPGSPMGVCTGTEAIFVAKDIAAGVVTAAGPDSDPNSCLQCLYANSCANDKMMHIEGIECGDGTGANFESQCLATLACVASASSSQDCWKGDGAFTPAAGNDTFCYCGAGGYTSMSPGPTTCESNGSAANGPCFAAETAGFSFSASDATHIILNWTALMQPSGMANNLIECARNAPCTQCLQ